jgi:hypothetical protein
VSFITTGLRELALKVRRQKTRMALRHEKRLLQKSEINLGREGCQDAANFPEVRNEIVALKKLEQEQKEVALRIAKIEEAIKKIQNQRQENTKEQNAGLAKLEDEKRPLVQSCQQAKAAADLCERELNVVERKIQENDAADRELLKQLSALQAQTPAPADLNGQTERISTERTRLPGQRAEFVRGRQGSVEALRAAKEKLAAEEARVAAADKNIARVRGEFEARDRSFAESSRTQQEEVRKAREQHQTVEERKNPAYLNIGRHLATQGIAPPAAPHLLIEVRKHRAAVDRHLAHTAELAGQSSQIDKQELRKFYFTVFSVLALLAIILPLVFQSPAKREWLPQETEAILSLNTDQFARNDLPKRWKKEQPEQWQNIWIGLLGRAAETPVLDVARDTRRVTRAMTVDETGARQDFVLVEARGELTAMNRTIAKDPSFERSTVSGLVVWRQANLAVARIGPKTLAVGSSREVNQLVEVRLGMRPDLKITGQLFDRFQALDQESALRLISRNPPDLARLIHPVFVRELLDSAQLLGLALTLQNPVKARLLLKMKSAEKASELAGSLHNEPQRWLQLQDSNVMLYAEPPEVIQHDANLEVRFNVPDETARLLLQRIAKVKNLTPVAGSF